MNKLQYEFLWCCVVDEFSNGCSMTRARLARAMRGSPVWALEGFKGS